MKKIKNSRWLTIRLDEKLLNDFDDVCVLKNISKSKYVRLLIAMEIVKYGKN